VTESGPRNTLFEWAHVATIVRNHLWQTHQGAWWGSTGGNGLWQDYLVKSCWIKNWGALGTNIVQESRNSRSLSGWGVGGESMMTKRKNWQSPGTKYKRSKGAFAVTSIELSLGHLGPRLWACRAVSKGSPVPSGGGRWPEFEPSFEPIFWINLYQYITGTTRPSNGTYLTICNTGTLYQKCWNRCLPVRPTQMRFSVLWFFDSGTVHILFTLCFVFFDLYPAPKKLNICI